MNELSWLIYFAQVLGDTSELFGSFGVFWTVISVIGFGAFAIFRFIVIPHSANSNVDGSYHRYSSDEHLQKIKECLDNVNSDTYKTLIKVLYVTFSLATFCHIASVLLPNRQTIILIAASQISEKIINNDRIIGIVDPSLELLKTYAEKELKKIKEGVK